MGIIGKTCEYIEKMPNWKKLALMVGGNAIALGILNMPMVLEGRDGINDERRYLTWGFDREPIRARVWKDKQGYIDTLRVYDGAHGELSTVGTVDTNKDGNPDIVGVLITTGERLKINRKLLFRDSFGRDPETDVLIPGKYEGKLTQEQAYKISPELSRFLTPEGLDVETLAETVSKEAYRMTEADVDLRFQITNGGK